MSEHPLFKAIHEDDRARVKQLLREDPSLARFSIARPKLYEEKILHWIYAGDTPLHLAAAGYRVEVIEMLLAAGADPDARQNHRASGPLHYAADISMHGRIDHSSRQVESIGLLLKAGAPVNAQDKNGAAPLHRAVRTRGADAVSCLIKSGADLLLRNKSGSTPFHLAVQNTGRGGSGSDKAKAAQQRIIEMFLSSGADPSIRDGNGKSVLDCARSDWIRELIEK